MAKKVSLKRNFILNLIVQALTVLAPLITAPYLSRVLKEDGNGIYSYSYAIITYFTLAANLGFAIYGQREIAKYQDDYEKRDRVFWEIFVLKLITSILSIGVLFSVLATIGFGSDYNKVILCLSIFVISCIFDVNYFFQGIEDFLSIAIRTILIKIVGTACIFIFVNDTSDVWVYALCMAITTIGSNVVMWPSIFKNVKFKMVRPKDLLRHIKPSVFVFLPTLAVVVYSVFDKTMIGLLSDNPKYDNGCYEQAYKINSTALILITVISPILIPRNAYDYEHGNMDSFNKHVDFAFHYVWLLGLPLIAGFLALSPNLSRTYLGPGYDSVPLMMQIMSVRFIFSGFGVIIGEQIFIPTGNEKYPTIATFAGAFVNIGLNYFFIKQWGAVGAAITTAISEVMVTTILFIIAVCKKTISLKRVLLMPWKYIIASLAMFGVVYSLQKYIWTEYSIMTFIILTSIGAMTYGIILVVLRDKFVFSLIEKGLYLLHLKKDVIDPSIIESDMSDEVFDNNEPKEEENNNE